MFPYSPKNFQQQEIYYKQYALHLTYVWTNISSVVMVAQVLLFVLSALLK